jgi:hypothetical protein
VNENHGPKQTGSAAVIASLLPVTRLDGSLRSGFTQAGPGGGLQLFGRERSGRHQKVGKVFPCGPLIQQFLPEQSGVRFFYEYLRGTGEIGSNASRSDGKTIQRDPGIIVLLRATAADQIHRAEQGGGRSRFGRSPASDVPVLVGSTLFERKQRDLSELVHEGQKACKLSLLCREGLLYFQGFARRRELRTKGSPQAEE